MEEMLQSEAQPRGGAFVDEKRLNTGTQSDRYLTPLVVVQETRAVYYSEEMVNRDRHPAHTTLLIEEPDRFALRPVSSFE
jgi:hypothetical protein